MNNDDLKLLTISYYEAFRTYREYGKSLPREIARRIDEETDIIINNHDSSGWYTLWWIFSHCPEASNLVLPTESRLHTSLIAFLFGITDVDPLPPHYYCSTCGNAGFVTDLKSFMNGSEPEIGCPKCGCDEQRFKLSGSGLKLKHDLLFDRGRTDCLFAVLKYIKSKIELGGVLDENAIWDISKALSVFPLDRVFRNWDTLHGIVEMICLDKKLDGKLDEYRWPY